MTIECLRCGGEYEQERRRASHFCPDCRKAMDNAGRAERIGEERARLREAADVVRARIVEFEAFGMSAEFLARYRRDLDDTLAELRTERAPRDVVPDRMPPGANSAAGPDDGCSTGWKDLQATLDERAYEAASHEWFRDNPHWAYELHDPEAFEVATSRTLRAS